MERRRIHATILQALKRTTSFHVDAVQSMEHKSTLGWQVVLTFEVTALEITNVMEALGAHLNDSYT